MSRLRGALQAKYEDREEDVKIYTPRNLETLEITFRGERIAKASQYSSGKDRLY
jgi:cleavage and polyadenylation specificity factor subunit 3